MDQLANATGLAFIAGIIVGIWLTRPSPPLLNSVNGAYRSDCCRAIVLRDGQALIEHRLIAYSVERLKTGELVVKLPKQLLVSGSRVVDQTNSTDGALIFGYGPGHFNVSDITARTEFQHRFDRVIS
ncbi:hypothetical protein [Sphingomonas antarctica]|uniref:hypothetical protein n=1 Tax=Sphingomonas antarctica TaxID=2040274 RepID=UPI0039E9B624